jgi:hypothetical protein
MKPKSKEINKLMYWTIEAKLAKLKLPSVNFTDFRNKRL